MWPKNQNKYFSSQTLVAMASSRWSCCYEGFKHLHDEVSCQSFTLFISHLLALRRRDFLLDAVEAIYRMEIYEIKAMKSFTQLNITVRWDREILRGTWDSRFFEEERPCISETCWGDSFPVRVWEQDYRQDIPLTSSGSFWDAFEQAEVKVNMKSKPTLFSISIHICSHKCYSKTNKINV